jgi:hypothetical protein
MLARTPASGSYRYQEPDWSTRAAQGFSHQGYYQDLPTQPQQRNQPQAQPPDEGTTPDRQYRRVTRGLSWFLVVLLGLSLVVGLFYGLGEGQPGSGAWSSLALCGPQQSLLCRTWHYAGYTWTHSTKYHTGLHSNNTAWVPNTDTAVSSPYVPAWVWQGYNGGSTSASSAPVSVTYHGGPICQWCRPAGLNGYVVHDYAAISGNKAALAYPFGQCTWLASYAASRAMVWMGNAKDWIGTAHSRGYPTGTTPAAGATVVFQAGVQGASSLGHVAHVEQVLGNGWFLIREMNFSGVDSGGWGRVSWRYVHTGPGVSFIY